MSESLEYLLAIWFESVASVSADEGYRHRRLKEKPDRRPEVLGALKAYVQAAHEDARRHIRRLVSSSLNPLNQPPTRDPAEGYPQLLHMSTKKGYLGEVLAGLVCEHFAPHGERGWKVPAYLFRFHNVAFEQLERVRQTGEDSTPIPGRTGNDCLAFIMDDQERVIRVLFCEAKCTSDHDSEMIRKAHEQLSDKVFLPVSLLQVIEVLKDRGGPEASRWISALQQLYLSGPCEACERQDLVSYACGRSPVDRNSWIPPDGPHESYLGGRKLEAVEIHLSSVEGLIRDIYGVPTHVKTR